MIVYFFRMVYTAKGGWIGTCNDMIVVCTCDVNLEGLRFCLLSSCLRSSPMPQLWGVFIMSVSLHNPLVTRLTRDIRMGCPYFSLRVTGVMGHYIYHKQSLSRFSRRHVFCCIFVLFFFFFQKKGCDIT